jgi:hypothetical protein
MRYSIAAASVALLLCGAGVSAHHSFSAEFDVEKPVKLTGTVTRVEWTNPHVWIYIDVKRPDGKTEEWGIEGGAPNALMRRGFRKPSLPAGTLIVIEGFRAKNGKLLANGRDVTLADGQKLFMGSAGSGAPDDSKHKDDK